ncbi:carbohydrate-binding domain-containing protein [Candidatus Saccharibacteria bacterium]|nr:carbohydrate-binding domain-containing protein [Candidatus Saccharibacteria bacterium]
MTTGQRNFWNGEAQDAPIPIKTPASEELPNKKFEFNWGILAGTLLLVAMIVCAVVLNLIHGHTGDNAANVAGTVNIDNGDININWERYPSYEVELSDTYTITTSGTYYLSGEISDGGIIINATKEDVVRLVLNNVSIKNSSGPTIACYTADDLVIELNGVNYLEDGAKYDVSLDEDVDGVIYSKSDLAFTGDGALTIKANHGDGIVSKDDLTFRNGTYNITAADDAIRGKDSVHISNGTFNIASSADAVKSNNDTDTTKGFILIEDGNLAIKASGKGIKATNSIIIYGGNFDIVSVDDSIHSNNYVGITNGDIKISSSDDGIHADARLIVDGGKINITKSYEGLEAQKISINAGEISVFSNDDGMNAGGGADSSSQNRAGANPFAANENCELVINGGSIYVNAAGDGIDSNGWLYFNGGNVVVDGPTNNGNGALDSGAGIVMNGGTVVAVGASGMAESLGNTSSVYNVSIYFTSTLAKGTEVTILDVNGDTIISHTSAKTFSHLAAGSSKFKAGETYYIYVDGGVYQSFTISSITTTVGNGGNMMMNAGQRR